MWTVAAANKRFKGSLGNYNGLSDQHLAHYFSSPVIKTHLIKTGLITKDGIIIPEADRKVHDIQKQKHREYQELLANAIVQKALHLENARQAQIRQHLEDIAKIELVERIKRPHTVGPISKSCKQPTMAESPYQFSCSSASLKGSVVSTRRAKSSDYSHRKLKTRANRKLSRSLSSSKSRNLDYDLDFRNMTSASLLKFQEGSKAYMRSKKIDEGKCQVTLFYHGNKIFWWMNKLPDQEQEIIIKQQHCGGSLVVVFKDAKIRKGNVTFISHRHAGYPFSITIFIDGMRDLKLSACCEYRYQRGSRLGGKTGHFSFLSVEGGSPCIQCQATESKWISRSPVLFFPKNSHRVSLMNVYLRDTAPIADAEVTNSVAKENFTFMKEDSISQPGSEVQEEEIKERSESIPDNEDDAEEVPDEVESLKADEVESVKADENDDDPISSVGDESPESIKSEQVHPPSEANEAYSEVDAGPEQCVDLEYDNDSGDDADTASHRTASSAPNVTKQTAPSKLGNKSHTVNIDAHSMSEDEGGEEYVVFAEVHASDTSNI